MNSGQVRVNDVLHEMFQSGVRDPVKISREVLHRTGRKMDPDEVAKILRKRELSHAIRNVLLRNLGTAMSTLAVMDEANLRLSVPASEFEVQAVLQKLVEKSVARRITTRSGRYPQVKWVSH